MRDKNSEEMIVQLAKQVGMAYVRDGNEKPYFLVSLGPSLCERIAAIEKHLGIYIEFGPHTVIKKVEPKP